MSTGFEKIWRDSQLQDHWIRRLLAFIIDSVIALVAALIITLAVSLLFVFTAIITGIPWNLFNLLSLPFFMGMVSIAYFTLVETYYGTTLGKMVMNLKTTTVSGRKPPLDVTLTRNITKIYWIAILIDTLVGLAMTGDPHQRAMDRVAGSTVVSTTISPMIITRPAPSAKT